MVANYGLSEAGITSFAPPVHSLADTGTKYETAVDEIDDDMFGSADDRFLSPVTEEMVGRMKAAAQLLLLDAYEEDLVPHPSSCSLPLELHDPNLGTDGG